MTDPIKEVWERFRHMDNALSDPKISVDLFHGGILYDLWQSIKQEIERRDKDGK